VGIWTISLEAEEEEEENNKKENNNNKKNKLQYGVHELRIERDLH
jgi:hypothetical protein